MVDVNNFDYIYQLFSVTLDDNANAELKTVRRFCYKSQIAH